MIAMVMVALIAFGIGGMMGTWYGTRNTERLERRLREIADELRKAR